MKTKLGSWLVVAPLELDNGDILPSPDDLKFKILIKSKVLPPDSTLHEYSTDTDTESEKGQFCIMCGPWCFVFCVKHVLIDYIPF